MDKIKWAYITGEVWGFIQVHNLMPIIVAFAVGMHVSYLSSARMDRFRLNYINDKMNIQMEINQIKDKVQGAVEGVATNSAILEKEFHITPTLTPKPMPTPKPLLKKPIAKD